MTAPIVGATKLEHLEDALAAEELSLSDDEIARLEEPYVPHAVSGIDLLTTLLSRRGDSCNVTVPTCGGHMGTPQRRSSMKMLAVGALLLVLLIPSAFAGSQRAHAGKVLCVEASRQQRDDPRRQVPKH